MKSFMVSGTGKPLEETKNRAVSPLHCFVNEHQKLKYTCSAIYPLL